MKHRLLTILACAVLPTVMLAQNNWGLYTSLGAEKGLSKGLSTALEAQYRQTDNFKSTDRWSVGASVSKRLYRNDSKTFAVKAGLGYKYMTVFNGWSTKYKGTDASIADNLDAQYYFDGQHDFNLNSAYRDVRHRVSASVQASMDLGRVRLTWREVWQYTHTCQASFTKEKYRFENGSYKIKTESDSKAAQDKNVLRSRFGVDYNIPNCKLDPFASVELFNGINNSFQTQKTRLTAGFEFSINKKHNFELAYMWQNLYDDDEPAGSVIDLGYTFKF